MLATIALLLAITPAALKAHIDFLASDALEGRETGTRGYDIAAQYVATQLEGAGVRPAGDGGTWFQQVRFRTFKLDPAQSSLCIAGSTGNCTPFQHRKDVLISTTADAQNSVDAEVVLAGFGITAPELSHDDYAQIDARGKIVAFVSGAPSTFPHNQRAYYSSSAAKYENAVAHGAVGVVTIRSLEGERRFAWSRMVGGSESVGMRALSSSGTPFEIYPQLRGIATLGPAASAALFDGEEVTLDRVLADAEKGAPPSLPLHKRVAIRTTTTIGSATSPNVVGVIPGSDPSRASEHVVLSAHLDHLGMTESGTDRIRNGALDNGSGIAALIEIARMITASKTRPARSIVILAVTAEEKGTQGSAAFADRPTVRGPVVADVNMDMLTMLFPLKSLVALGMEHSSLGPLARTAAMEAGFTLQPDPQPEEVRFIRSDQFSFVERGIPSITYKGGLESSDPSIDGDKIGREWLRTIYHSPRDEREQQIHYESGVRWAEANAKLIMAIANAKERPHWNAGDFFGTRFGRERRAKQ